jgi:drug/metabolite transporter (DMT)-like permease
MKNATMTNTANTTDASTDAASGLSATAHNSRHRTMFLFTFTAVCLIWGSTYLGNRFATETIPPLLMAGFRFMIAGCLLFGVLRLRGGRDAALPTPRQCWSAALVGVMLVSVGNGTFSLSAPHVPSGFASLLATSLPMWTVLVDWLRPNGRRPHNGVILGLTIGFLGIVWLVQPWNHLTLPTPASMPASTSASVPNGSSDSLSQNISHSDITGHLGYILLTCVGVITWAIGTVYARQADLPSSSLMTTAIQMFAGGAVMAILGTALGDWTGFDITAISAKSLAALVYLIIFGSIVAFSSYSWLVQNVSPAMAASYTYVNPIVALLLGATLAGETITSAMLIAGAVILGAVALVARYRNSAA